MNNPVWQDPKLLKLWMLCLLEASHKEYEQLVGRQIVKLQPGEFVTGRYALAKAFNDGAKKSDFVPESTIWRWMKWLEKNDFLNIKSTTKFSVISIKNWNLYQQNEQQMNNKRTTNEQQVDTNNNGNNVFSNSSCSKETPENFFLKNIRKKGFSVSPFEQQLIEQLENQYGYDLLMAAMKVTAKNGADNINYVEGVLTKWEESGVKNIDQAREYERRFKERVSQNKQKGKVYANKKSVDWEAFDVD